MISAITGTTALPATLQSIENNQRICLANKETLVVAGDLVMAEASSAGVQILPVDSEHNAIHQALRVGPAEGVKKLILTTFRGSGDPSIDNATVISWVSGGTRMVS